MCRDCDAKDCHRHTTKNRIVAKCIKALKKLEVPAKCIKQDGYAHKNFAQLGHTGRAVGTWEVTLFAPAPLGGDRPNTFALNLGGTFTLNSALVNASPVIQDRQMYQGDWWVTSQTDTSITLAALGHIIYNDQAGNPLAFGALKSKFTIVFNEEDPLLDTIVDGLVSVQVYAYNFVDGDPTNPLAVPPYVPATGVITVPYAGGRLANTPYIRALKDLYNDCSNGC